MTGLFVQFNSESRRAASHPIGWIEDGSGCHVWTGSRTHDGYGNVRVGGASRLVHRVRYEREVGPIPAGTELDHFVCDNRACCNPLHCRPVAHRENTLRGDTFAARKVAQTHCLRGHPLAGDNLLPYPLLRGGRNCRVCANAYARAWQRRRRALRKLN